MTKILFLAGSARKESLNKRMAKHAAKIAGEMGVDANFIDLADFPMPIYNGDLEDESGLPEQAERLKKLFIECDGFFITSPEYNSSFSPLLKNALDWISRKSSADEEALIAFKGKVAAISAVSPGGFGGLRGLVPLRMMLGNIMVTVVPNQFALSHGGDAFDDEGLLKDEKNVAQLKGGCRTACKNNKCAG